MSRRPDRNGRRIHGPQSALTDYLASHNIVASDIAASYQRRRAEAARQAAEEAEQAAATVANGDAETAEAEAAPSTSATPTAARATRRTRTSIQQETVETPIDNDDKVDDDDDFKDSENEKSAKKRKAKAAVDKIKKRKAMKRKHKGDGSDYDDLADLLNEASKKAPLPGQMDYCAVCEKRFTVTPYTRADKDGNLLCPTHSKELDAEDKKNAPLKKKPRVSGTLGSRRKTQSAILDGANYLGAKSLLTLCIEQLARNIDLADDLGSLPDEVVDRIARMLSKRRLLKPETLQLFVRPEVDTINIYTGSKLSTADIKSVFQTCPNLKHFKLYDGIAFDDEVMEYLADRDIELESLYLHGANLISEKMWENYIICKGMHLKSLKVSCTDRHVNDKFMLNLGLCENLERLKITHNEQATGKGLENLRNLKKLEHLSLDLQKVVEPSELDALLAAVGPQLKTFSMRNMPNFTDFILTRIMADCRALKKLRITGSEELTDHGFAQFFNNWTTNAGLEFIDFSKCRHLESSTARTNPDNIGLGPEGFVAMMKHSGDTLQYLNVHSCRFITIEAFQQVFNEDKVYPELIRIDLSNVEKVNDAIVEAIFRSCPNLHELLVFACFKVRDARVPSGKLLVGVPNAVGMQIEGA